MPRPDLSRARPGEQAKRIDQAFRRAGIDPELCFVDPEKLAETAHEVAGRSDIVVAAGGDGTLQSVAQGVLGTSAAFAVLPVGTFNHLAKELKMPLELEAAAEAIARGERRAFPIPTVNGRPFLSFAALGLYARAIRHREAQRKARQRSKMLGMVMALVRILRRPPYRRFGLEIGGRIVRRYTSSIFVVCNEYQLQALGLLESLQLDRAQLNVCVSRTSTRWQVFRLLLAGLFGRTSGVMEVLSMPQLTIHTRHRYETAVLDGELATLEVPLRFSMSPVPLIVIAPPVELHEQPTSVIYKRS